MQVMLVPPALTRAASVLLSLPAVHSHLSLRCFSCSKQVSPGRIPLLAGKQVPDTTFPSSGHLTF